MTLQRDLAVHRALEVGLIPEDQPYSPGGYRREHVVGLDGKVFSSPQRTLDTERVNRVTGELRPVRTDTARQRYGEGGVEGLVWGTKYAIASVRSPLTNHRVILGISHFDATTPGGEGRVFTDLALDLARRTNGIHAFTADGAWRGTHLNQIQSTTGRAVIAPPRRRTGRGGGIVIDGHGHAAQPLPWSRRRIQREADCGGPNCGQPPAHSSSRSSTPTAPTSTANSNGTKPNASPPGTKTAAAATSSTPATPSPALGTPTTTGGNPYSPPTTTPKPGSTAANTYASSPPPATTTNACTDAARHRNLNAQLERAFYGQRLPAWGIHNQTVIVILATQAENAWARQTWHNEAARQRGRPQAAA